MKTIQFDNNDSMQAIGLGTWKATGDEVKNAVKEALNAGVRHIDTAAIYGNESEIGEALEEVFAEGKVARSDVFITTKLWNNAHTKDLVMPALQESLNKLKLDYLDLYLIHWPVAFKPGITMPSSQNEYMSLEEVPIIETWNEMEKVKAQGYARHIGVSNFSKKKLEDLVSKATVRPEMNQVEMHPLLQQNDLVSYCNNNNIKLTAYSPLGSGDRSAAMKGENEPNLMDISEIKDIAAKHNVSPAQVLINWHTQRNISVIPKSVTKSHIRSNFEASDVPLDSEDMQTIAGLDKNYRFITGKFFEAPDKGYVNIYDE
ncbi:MAG: aldo/keto reductase [Flavobacteriaceae bacterium]|nr:aldo/keto reductase [Flavobacteriaceae bacterium]